MSSGTGNFFTPPVYSICARGDVMGVQLLPPGIAFLQPGTTQSEREGGRKGGRERGREGEGGREGEREREREAGRERDQHYHILRTPAGGWGQLRPRVLSRTTRCPLL